MKNIIKRIWPLPPPEKRRLWPFILTPGHIKNGIRLERDGDYVCYLAGALAQIIGLLLIAILILDIVGNLLWFIDYQTLAARKATFTTTWMSVIGKVAFVLIILSYLRIRLFLNLEKQQIPFWVTKNSLRGRSRKDWIQVTGFLLTIMLVFMPMYHVSSRGLLEIYDLENNLTAVIIWQLVMLLAVPLFVSFSISMALILEKAIRFFPQAQEDLESW